MKQKPLKKQNNSRAVPRGAKRRMELAAVAERVFLTRGFTDTTMQMIASEAGGSKETLYRHFESKEALFAEIIGHRAALISSPDSALARDTPPEKVMFDLGLSLMQMMTGADTVSLFRIVVAEAPRSPELAQIIYMRGSRSTRARLTAYLRGAVRRRQLRCADPLRAAKLFLGAVVSHYHLHSLIGQPTTSISPAEMRSHVKEAVAMFMARYGVDQ